MIILYGCDFRVTAVTFYFLIVKIKNIYYIF